MKRLFSLILIFSLLPAAVWAQRVNQTPNAASSFMGAAPKPALQRPVMPPAAPVAAAPPSQLHDRIAAVVNDNVISTDDIEARMKLALLSSGLPPTREVAQNLLPQILRSLIDEQLQLQEAKRLDITVPKEDIDKAMDRIAHDNNIPGGMREYVKSHGASPEALEQQMRGGLAWGKVVQRELRPRVEIGDDEVDAVIDRMRANAGKQEFLVSEIFLSVDNPKDEAQIKQVADNLVQQIKGGANFTAVARQFSQGTGAAAGGDIGWIQEGQLPAELNHALVGMQKGDISAPIRSSSGFHILGLREKRTIAVDSKSAEDISLDLQQAFRPFDAAAHETVLQDAKQLRANINGCTNLQNQLTQKYPSWHWQNLGNAKLAKLPPWLAEKVRDTPAGKGSEPIATDKGALIVFVCERHVPEGKADREAIINSLGTEKLELQARRLMRDLRRSAYLDIRLGSGS
jgi:peptidyl-prolyl cis-trans isomerase SurA